MTQISQANMLVKETLADTERKTLGEMRWKRVRGWKMTKEISKSQI